MNYDLPDPERAKNNIKSFLSENPDYTERLNTHYSQVATLFSYSQFLANYCIKNPEALFNALNKLSMTFETGHLRTELKELLSSCSSIDDGMKAIRNFRKNKFLIVTLKDILRLAELQEIMLDMSNLADAILWESLDFAEPFLKLRYGAPENNSLAVIALGKLGALELNYSSDVDIIFVYKEEGETSGISTIHGMTINKISAFEYYTKLVEEYTRFLSANTEDGFAYRVDLRLRPQGQRGSLVLSLRGYEEYYESWGQLWERAALLRARPAAGDMQLGQEFLKTIKPFVYRKYLDFEAIDEIRRMKSQVEQIKAATLSRDIKRGYGGIREIEFFIQIFQLIYSGKEPGLRERSTFMALHKLLQKGLIGYEDFGRLSDNYIFLRTLEHRLQQLNDIQTHTLPSSDAELDILGKKIGFLDRSAFLSELNKRRHKVRTIYDSLLESRKEPPQGRLTNILSSIFWDMETPIENLLTEELSKTKIRDVRKAMHYLMKIRNTIFSFQTIKGRRLLEDILPRFIDEALKGINPDLALLQLVDFSNILAAKESYLEAIAQRPEIISVLNFIFSQSEYLSKILMGSPEYIESIVEGEIRKKSLSALKNELKMLIDTHGEVTAIRLLRRFEEIKLGILFLDRKIGVIEIMKGLSKTADAILSTLLERHGDPLNIIAFGKLGGREIIFNSDLDLIFITLNEPTERDIKAAEKLLRVCTSYTKDGIAYRVDTRLRPEGSKGPLVSSIKGIRDYYLRHAQAWELQALLKARPINGSRTHIYFMDMRKEVLMERGNEITIDDIKKMRERIQRELSKETSGTYDIKLGSGGLEELEFIVQYLQLRNCKKHPQLLVQGTLDGISRLNKNGIMKNNDAMMLKETYIFYRTIETILRLRNESFLKEDSSTLQSLANFMNMDGGEILSLLNEKRAWIIDSWNKIT
ncbi:MAG: bifunctional [glutamate--ammonia ligase]-adenylyl-L-tyrosine phosphorylase/[glutamate--ammonia-ligase] adenylyltransferase [Nitrospirae bacterium]|jgi:glutamate-ammonia-ligase adenylyltransferase|nr:bifunctional [glutamate--ammonia ligase]-adenylyl-L-tyrosine phosphorylase/[glutamate--ammonia-ligase] adenylyltransferase [Nitrospirota bacterium]